MRIRRVKLAWMTLALVGCTSTGTSDTGTGSVDVTGGAPGVGGSGTAGGSGKSAAAGKPGAGGALAGGASGGASAGTSSAGQAGVGNGGASGAAADCAQCAASTACAAGSVCAQLVSAQDSFCLPTCTATCAQGSTCVAISTTEGDQVNACVPVTQCGGASTGGMAGGGSGGAAAGGAGAAAGATAAGGMGQGGKGGGGQTSEVCGTLLGPDLSATCASCKSGTTCQPNGCYGGWWCNSQSSKCQAPPNPAACATGTGGQAGSGQAGAGQAGAGQAGSGVGGSGPAGPVGKDGGTVSTLRFAIVGDTRPAIDNDTKGYPSAIIGQIWADVQARSPRPDFAVTTGDYMFASPSSGQAGPQLDLYLKARAVFGNVTFPALGNHECTGATASNCGAQGADGLTDNYNQFLSKMLGPLGKTTPYYSVLINGTSGWTAKLVFIAANAWSTAQATWLDQTLSQPTTYTFVVRHESDSVSGVTGVTASKAIVAAHPVTLKIVGHTHTYEHFQDTKEVVVGNGGAPLAGSVNYGYVVGEQRADGAIVFTAYDYATGAAFDTWAVDASGNPA